MTGNERMARPDSPLSWECPHWHPDYGDNRQEFEQLRSFALLLLSSLSAAKVELEMPEPGLVDVRVVLPNGIIAEVYSVDSCEASGQRRLALYFSPDTSAEEEVYADSVEIAVDRFREL